MRAGTIKRRGVRITEANIIRGHVGSRTARLINKFHGDSSFTLPSTLAHSRHRRFPLKEIKGERGGEKVNRIQLLPILHFAAIIRHEYHFRVVIS